jgi:hypothetical protein
MAPGHSLLLLDGGPVVRLRHFDAMILSPSPKEAQAIALPELQA